MLTLALLACTEPETTDTAEPASTFAVELDPDMPLRATARWPAGTESWVGWEDRATEPTTAGEARLLGLPADTTLDVTLYDATGPRETVTVATGSAPDEFPTLEVSGEGFGSGYLVSTWAGPDGASPYAFALDGSGRLVWYESLTPFVPADADRSNPVPWGVRAGDGAAWVSLMSWGAGIAWLPFDGTPPRSRPLEGAHHDFEVLADGSLAYLRAVTRTIDGELVTGDELVLRSSDRTVVLWNAFDALPIERHEGWSAFPEAPGDWTHANGVTLDPVTRTWTISLYWLHTLVQVDERTGASTLLDGRLTPEPFGPQHSPGWSGPGWWMFDNASPSTGSRALHLSPTGERLEAWAPPGNRYTPVVGDVEHRADDLLAVSMGPITELWVVGPASGGRETLLFVRGEGPASFGQVAWVDSLTAP